MIRLIRPYVDFDEVQPALRAVFESGIFTRGTNVEAFRSAICSYTGASRAYLTTSATTALWLCLKRLGIGPGDEVVVSDFSFPATANVVEDLGARPVFADVSLETYNMTPECLEAAVSSRTRAVIFVDALGNPTGVSEVAKVCRARNIPLIEDAACAIGSSEGGVRCGAIADMTCFSFHPRKLLTTGEGGAITTRDPKDVSWFERKLNHGANGMIGHALDFVDYGYNFRLSELQAVLGCAQLPKLEAIVAHRNAMRSAYIDQLAIAGFTPQYLGEDVESNVQSLVFRVAPRVSRDGLIETLRSKQIESTIGTYCMSGTSYYKGKYDSVQRNSKLLQKTTITLPCHAGVDVDYVCSAILQASAP